MIVTRVLLFSALIVVYCAGYDGFFFPPQRLDGKHVVFGQVVEGKEVVDNMEKVGSSSGA